MRGLRDRPDVTASGAGTVRNLVCWAIVTPMEGAYGNQERHPGQFTGGDDPQAVFARDGLFDELKKAFAERVLNAEIDDHLDGEAAAGKRDSRNGYSKKRVLTETSKLDLRIPRGRGRSIRS
jgi:Transposase, Mutator family